MANRSYLYSLDNRPKTYADRPETISALSEWAYAVPFSYRALLSGDPQLCASFVSEGFDEEPAEQKTKIYAISSDFELGFTRLKRLFSIIQPLAECAPSLLAQMQQTVTFLEAHRNRYLLLETVELDMMSAETGPALRARVEAEVNECRRVGAAIDALIADSGAAGAAFKAALEKRAEPPFDVFWGLRLDDSFDDASDDEAKKPLGLSGWDGILFYRLWNRAEFEQRRPPKDVTGGNAGMRFSRERLVGVLCVALGLLMLLLIGQCSASR